MTKFGYINVPLTYMVALVMCITTITAPWLRVPLAAAQQFTLSADARDFLEGHNQLRAAARVANLVWNDSLVAVAKSFVEQQCVSLALCSSGAQGVPAYSSGQNFWCIVANANPQPTSASQTGATSSHWVTSSFASYDGHCDGDEGDGEEGGGGSVTGAAPAGPVAHSAPAPVGSRSDPVPTGSVGSITGPTTSLVRSGIGMPPFPNDDASGNTGTKSSPIPGSSSGGGGIDAVPPLIVPGTGSSNEVEEGDGNEGDGGEEGDHHCGNGEGDGGNAAQYFAQMADDKTVSTGCYTMQCTANGVSYAACEYFPALPGIPNPPPAPLMTK